MKLTIAAIACLASGAQARLVGVSAASRTLPENEHAVALTKDTFDQFLQDHPHAMVNFYAPWCHFSQDFAPTWEDFALAVQEENIPVGIGKVDCSTESSVCDSVSITAYPTVRWIQDGQKALSEKYKGDRTVGELLGFIRGRVTEKEMQDKAEAPEVRALRVANTHM